MILLNEFLDLRAKEHGWDDFDYLLNDSPVIITIDDEGDEIDTQINEPMNIKYVRREVVEKLINEWIAMIQNSKVDD